MNVRQITELEANQRLDKYLLKLFNKAPKSFIYKMLRKKRIKLNGGRAEGHELLAVGDEIKFYLAEETMLDFMEERRLNPSTLPIEVVYEDENILAAYKPCGVLSHSESADDSDTMIDRILNYLHDKNEFSIEKDSTFVPALSNRLDRNTSGIVLCGKNLPSVQELNRAIAENKIQKFYYALVSGELSSGELSGFIAKDEKTNKASILSQESENTKPVITKYKQIATNKSYSLMEVQLITGRTHQIRVHLASILHPIVGDVKYGGKMGLSKFQLLHAKRIVFGELSGHLRYLSGKKIESSLPQEFSMVCKNLGLKNLEE